MAPHLDKSCPATLHHEECGGRRYQRLPRADLAASKPSTGLLGSKNCCGRPGSARFGGWSAEIGATMVQPMGPWFLAKAARNAPMASSRRIYCSVRVRRCPRRAVARGRSADAMLSKHNMPQVVHPTRQADCRRDGAPAARSAHKKAALKRSARYQAFCLLSREGQGGCWCCHLNPTG